MQEPCSPALDDVLVRLPQLVGLRAELYAALAVLERCARAGHTVLLCGNGGSAADADHIAAELMKSFVYRRPLPAETQAALRAQFPAAAAELIGALETPIPAIALGGQVATLTAFSNDVDYRYAFAQQVFGLGRPGDVLLAISTSGNSPNVLHAAQVARVRGLSVIGLTGASGGRLRELSDVALCAPAEQTHLIQELHLPLYHALCLALEERLFSDHGRRS
ncbi:MAG: SIS domain-containing protein [Polyangiales bacterium]